MAAGRVLRFVLSSAWCVLCLSCSFGVLRRTVDLIPSCLRLQRPRAMLIQLSLARCALVQSVECTRSRQSVVCASLPPTPHAHGAPVRLRVCAARLDGRVALQRGGSSLRAAASDGEDEEGFEVDLQVVGMRCEGCVENVTKALQATANVKQVSVDLATGVATCEVTAETMVRPRAPTCVASLTHAQFDAVVLTPALIAAVKGAGFVATAIL